MFYRKVEGGQSVYEFIVNHFNENSFNENFKGAFGRMCKSVKFYFESDKVFFLIIRNE